MEKLDRIVCDGCQTAKMDYYGNVVIKESMINWIDGHRHLHFCNHNCKNKFFEKEYSGTTNGLKKVDYSWIPAPPL